MTTDDYQSDHDVDWYLMGAQIIDGSYPGLSNEPRWIEDDHADPYSDEQVNIHGNVIDYGPQFGEES